MSMYETAGRHADWIGKSLHGRNGDEIGNITDIFLDDRTGQPEWLVVSAGWFGTKRRFVPIAGTRRHDDSLVVEYSQNFVKDAPSIDVDDDRLPPAEERRLYEYYGLDYDAADHATAYGGRERADEGFEYDDRRTGEMADEEGRARLYKLVDTDDGEVLVPVRRKVARVVESE